MAPRPKPVPTRDHRRRAAQSARRDLGLLSRRGAVRLPLLVLVACICLAGLFGAYSLWTAEPPSDALAVSDASAERPHAERPHRAGPTPEPQAAAAPPVGRMPPVSDQPRVTAQEAIDEAVGVLEHLTARFPKNPDAHEVAGRFYLWVGETAAATAAWETCLELSPSYVHAYNGLGAVAAKRGEHEQAVAMYRKALSIHPDSPTTRIELAKALMAVQQTDEAVTVLQETVAQYPAETEACYQLGTAYFQQQDFTHAKQSFETTLALEPRYAAAQIGLANACMRLGLAEEARQHREKFEQLRAGEVEQSRQERLQFDDAQVTRQQVSRTFTDAGRVYLAEEDPAATQQVWMRAATLDPQNLSCRQGLAWLHLQQGEPLQAIRILQELAALEPYNLSYPLEIARLYAGERRFSEAEETLHTVRQAAPEDAAAYAALAELYLQTGQKLPHALELAEKAVELTPSAEHYALLSGVYERSQQWSQATDAMAHAVRMAPDEASYRKMHALLKQREAQSSTEAD